MSTAKSPDDLPDWFVDAIGNYDAPQESFQKALTVTTPIVPVYAKWLTCMTGICGETLCANQWVVWWTNTPTPTFEVFSKTDFDERFVLESQAPTHMQSHFDAMPSYENWVDMHNADVDGVAQ